MSRLPDAMSKKSGGNDMKLWLTMIIVLVLLAACGEPQDDKKEETESTGIQKEDEQENKDSKDKLSGTSMPEDYPEDILPVYKGAKTVMSTVTIDGSSQVNAVSEDSMEEVIDFYRRTLEDGEDLVESQGQDTYFMTGILKGYDLIVSVSAIDEDDYLYEGYESLIALVATPGAGESSDELISISNQIQWPEGYPEDAVPAYEDGEVLLVRVMDMGVTEMLAFLTKDEIDRVAEHYESHMKEADGLGSTITQDGAYFQELSKEYYSR